MRKNMSTCIFCRFRISTYVKYVKLCLLGRLFGNGLYIQVVRDLRKRLAKPSDIQNPSDPNPSDTDVELFVLLPILGSDIGCATRTRNDARAWTRFSAHCRTQVIIIAFRTLPIPFNITRSHQKAHVNDFSFRNYHAYFCLLFRFWA